MDGDNDYPFNLGKFTWPITTTSPVAQLWFDRGIQRAWGFSHEEAVRCLTKALDADPGCAMAYWAIAYCLGINYNEADIVDPVSSSNFSSHLLS